MVIFPGPWALRSPVGNVVQVDRSGHIVAFKHAPDPFLLAEQYGVSPDTPSTDDTHFGCGLAMCSTA